MPFSLLERIESRRFFSVVFDGPIEITHGGTYRGNWKSDDPQMPAVVIRTSQPVIIENSNIESRGHLIVSAIAGANIVVRETRGTGLNPNVRGKAPGRFFIASNFARVQLVDNSLENTSGIYLHRFDGDPSKVDSIKILRNRAHNIDGRKSDGRGGYMKFNTRRRIRDGVSEDGFDIVQFVQLDQVRHIPGIEIGWNQVINEPEKSRVEDNISIYLSSGTRASPMYIHDNYIQGAYTIQPAMKSWRNKTYEYDWSYSGGGIMLGDGSADRVSDAAGFVQAYRNTVVDTSNYGMAVSAGHDMQMFSNRIVSSGRLKNGRMVSAQNVGAYIWDFNDDAQRGTFFNNVGRDNVIGWEKSNGRNDWWVPDAKSWKNSRHWRGVITAATVSAELPYYMGRAVRAGIRLAA